MTKSIATSFFNDSIKELELTNERKIILDNIAETIKKELTANKVVNLNFICTHNSRRSQLAQVWAHFGVNYFGLKNIYSFSGGIETTAFYANTVKTLQEVGFEFHIKEFSHQNPVYEITSEVFEEPLVVFSKLYNHPINQNPFMAITTCSHADENCPFIPEANYRFHLGFDDPKTADNKNNALEVYKKTSKLIAGELGYLFQNVSEQLS